MDDSDPHSYPIMVTAAEGATTPTVVVTGRVNIRSGHVDLRGSGVYGLSQSGFFWSHSSLSSSIAYRPHFASNTVVLDDNYYRYIGYPLRCLYLGSV